MDDSQEAWNDQILTLTCPKPSEPIPHSAMNLNSSVPILSILNAINIPSRKLVENKCFPLNKCHQNIQISNRHQFDSKPDSNDFWCHSMQHIPYCFTPPIRSGGLFFIGISYPTMVLTLPTAGVRTRKAPSELWVRSVQSNDSTGKVSSKNVVPSANQNLVKTWNL